MRQLIFEYFISQLIFCCWITFINFVKAVFSLHDVLDLDLRDTGRTLHRYHAWVCGFRSGVTSPELLIMLSYCCLEMF